jgi:hypothetical protein
MKNNLFKISSLNIYENSLKKFKSLKKVQKTAKQTLETAKTRLKKKIQKTKS